MDSNAKMLISRLPPNAPPQIAVDIETLFGIGTGYSDKSSAINSDNNLSDAGRAAERVEALRGGLLAHFRQVERGFNEARQRMANARSEMLAKVTEARNYPDHLKAEARAYLRGLSKADHARALLGDDALLHEAILEAPAFLTGVSPDDRSALVERLTEAKFPEQWSLLQMGETAYGVADAAARVVAGQMAREAGITGAEFDKLAA